MINDILNRNGTDCPSPTIEINYWDVPNHRYPYIVEELLSFKVCGKIGCPVFEMFYIYVDECEARINCFRYPKDEVVVKSHNS